MENMPSKYATTCVIMKTCIITSHVHHVISVFGLAIPVVVQFQLSYVTGFSNFLSLDIYILPVH